MRIINWNIKWGGLGKEKDIVGYILSKDADLVIITEYKNNESGLYIKNNLHINGFFNHKCSSKLKNKNGVGVFSKSSIILESNDFEDRENVCVFQNHNITFISAFCANDIVTENFIKNIEKRGRQDKTIIIGDLNTGPRGSMPNRYQDLDRIVSVGYVDLWRKFRSEICWSFQSKNGKSQPDHAFSTDDLPIENIKIDFDLSPIYDGTSEHGIMLLEIGNFG